MIKRLFLYVFFFAISAIISPAYGQVQDSQAQSVTLTGKSIRICTLEAPELGNRALENFSAPLGSIFIVQQLSDPSTLTTKAASLSLNLLAMCNSPHRILVKSENNGLWRQGSSSLVSGFGTAVPYDLEMSWGDEVSVLVADAMTRRVTNHALELGRPNFGSIEVRFNIEAGATNVGLGEPMLAGNFSDVVTLTLEAQ